MRSRATYDPAGPAEGLQRVCRGGSWLRDANFARSACRSSDLPEIRIDHMGFRVLLVLPRRRLGARKSRGRPEPRVCRQDANPDYS